MLKAYPRVVHDSPINRNGRQAVSFFFFFKGAVCALTHSWLSAVFSVCLLKWQMYCRCRENFLAGHVL